MTVNQKAAVLATIELRLDNICNQLERETDPEWRADLIESLGELAGGYAAISAIEWSDGGDPVEEQ